MELSRIIMGQVVTEKAERQKAASRTYTLRVDPAATKIDVSRALEAFFGVEVQSVRMLRVRVKARALRGNRVLTKRQRSKRVMVTWMPKSKVLDPTTVKVSEAPNPNRKTTPTNPRRRTMSIADFSNSTQ